MRTGPRVVIVCLFLLAGMCSRAWAADSLSVYADNNHAALGAVTTLAAHAETDAAFGGGRVVWKYGPSARGCAPTPDTDPGTDADGPVPATIAPGAAATDLGGQTVALTVGHWRICGWLVDTSNGATVAAGATLVDIVPYIGSVAVSVRRLSGVFQFVVSYATSAPAHVFAWVQKAHKACGRKPAGRSVWLVPRGGRFVGSDGGLGRALPASHFAPGRYRICASVVAGVGRAGPATRSFAVPRRRHGASAGG